MKINELISNFEIFVTNEELAILESITELTPLSSFQEREQEVINNLIRKSIVKRVRHHNEIMVIKNDVN